MAVQEPENRWWVGLGLSDPEGLLKLFASRSGCLRVVDRDGGLALHNGEQGLAQSGELVRGSNVGRGQVAAADYFIIPDIVNSGGAAVGALGGGLLPGAFGALGGSLHSKTSEAHTLITLVNARTTEQIYVAEGTARKTDIAFGAGGGGWSGFAAAAGGGYANTDTGKVIAAAYYNSFVDLVRYMQSNAAPEPGSASAYAGVPAYTATGPTALRDKPLATAKAIRSFAPGDLVYPTGQKQGVWWEADDESGNRGWVESTAISPR